jgi:hypothetical protein
MIIGDPFRFHPDAARAWLVDDPDGKGSYAETEGIDAEWGASGHLDDGVTRDLGNLLHELPPAVLTRPDRYAVMVDALVDSEEWMYLSLVALPALVTLAGVPDNLRGLVEADRHADAQHPGVERAVAAVGHLVAEANQLVNQAIAAFRT